VLARAGAAMLRSSIGKKLAALSSSSTSPNSAAVASSPHSSASSSASSSAFAASFYSAPWARETPGAMGAGAATAASAWRWQVLVRVPRWAGVGSELRVRVPNKNGDGNRVAPGWGLEARDRLYCGMSLGVADMPAAKCGPYVGP